MLKVRNADFCVKEIFTAQNLVHTWKGKGCFEESGAYTHTPRIYVGCGLCNMETDKQGYTVKDPTVINFSED